MIRFSTALAPFRWKSYDSLSLKVISQSHLSFRKQYLSKSKFLEAHVYYELLPEKYFVIVKEKLHYFICAHFSSFYFSDLIFAQFSDEKTDLLKQLQEMVEINSNTKTTDDTEIRRISLNKSMLKICYN